MNGKLILSILIGGGISMCVIPLSTTSCKQNKIWDAHIKEWQYTFNHDQVYDPKWETPDSDYQNPMNPANYRQEPYSNKCDDKNMLNDISPQLSNNSMVNAVIRTNRSIFNTQEGYDIQDISLNVHFKNNQLLLHYFLHVTYQDYFTGTHNQIVDIYSLHLCPLSWAYDGGNVDNAKPALQFGTRLSNPFTTLAYWHYDLFDDVDQSLEIHAKPIMMTFFMYPRDWHNTHLPYSGV